MDFTGISCYGLLTLRLAAWGKRHGEGWCLATDVSRTGVEERVLLLEVPYAVAVAAGVSTNTDTQPIDHADGLVQTLQETWMPATATSGTGMAWVGFCLWRV